MTAVLFGVAAALVYGAADFTGGLAAKRTPALTVVALSQFAGLVVLLVALPLLGTPVPPARDLALGAAGGLGGGVGVVFLYRGLANGRMGIVAPMSAVGAAVLPVVFGLATGEQPGGLAFAGAAVALLAVVAVSSGPGSAGAARRGLFDAVLAGIGFGAFFVVLAQVGEGAGMWPLATARASVIVVGLAALLTRTALRAPRAALPAIAAAGVGDMLANVLYVLAVRTGLLSLVAVLVALYPASTVLLARLVLGERLARVQTAGILLAVTGTALIAAG